MVVLVLGVLGYAADSFLEQREADRLVARVGEVQSQIGYSQHRILSTVDYTRPLLFGASVTPTVQRGLEKLIEDTAAGQVPPLQRQRDRVANTTVLPWHRARQRARTALLAYLDVRIAYLRAVATEVDALYREHPELQPSFDAAQEAFRAMAGPTGRHRIEVAFAGGITPA